jgi:hypothetical protein
MGAVYAQYTTNLSVVGNYFGDVYGTNDNNCGGAWDGFVHGVYSDFGNGNSTVVDSNVFHNVMKPIHNNNQQPIRIENNLCIDTRGSENLWQFLSRNSNNVNMVRNVWKSDGTFNVRSYYTSPQFDVNVTVSNWLGNITYSVSGSNAANPTNATSSDPLFVKVPTGQPVYSTDMDLRFSAGSPAPALGIQPLSLLNIGYNGGLTNEPGNVVPVTSSMTGGVTLSGGVTIR